MAHQMKLLVEGGPKDGTEYPLDAEVLRLGRERARTIPLDDPQVSRRHAEIACAGEDQKADSCAEWRITDLGSLNGTFVNGERLAEQRALHDGDRVRVGSTVFRLESGEEDRRFNNLLAVLLALSTLAGAFLAWRVGVASGAAGGADGVGLGIVQKHAETETRIGGEILQSVDAYSDYDWRIRLSDLATAQSVDDAGDDLRAALRQEALLHRKLATVALRWIDLDYTRQGPGQPAIQYDRSMHHDRRYAEEATYTDLDFLAHFRTADRERWVALWLSGLTIILGLSVFFYTCARVSSGPKRRRFALTGFSFFFVASIAALVIDVFAH